MSEEVQHYGTPPAQRPPLGGPAPLNLFAELDADFYLRRFTEQQVQLQPFDAAAPRADEVRLLQRYLASLPLGWSREVEERAAQIPALAPSCRMVLAIPCRFEERRIVACLRAIARAVRAPDQLEVLILENHRSGEEPDATRQVVADYCRSESPGFAVRLVSKVFSAEEGYFGLSLARRLLADIVALRCAQRGAARPPVYIASMDADVVDVQTGALEAVVQFLDRHPWVDAVRGLQDRQPELLSQNALLCLERRAWYFAERLLSARRYWPDRNPSANFTWHRNVTGGWNTFFRVGVYAQIGGYSRLRFLEDVDIGNRISVLRGKVMAGGQFRHDVRSIVGLPLRMSSSPARFIHALLRDIDPYGKEDGYDSFFGLGTERIVKADDSRALLELLEPYGRPQAAVKQRFDDVLQRLRISLREIDEPGSDRLFRRVLAFLGFRLEDYVLGAQVDVRTYDRFISNVLALRARHS